MCIRDSRYSLDCVVVHQNPYCYYHFDYRSVHVDCSGYPHCSYSVSYTHLDVYKRQRPHCVTTASISLYVESYRIYLESQDMWHRIIKLFILTDIQILVEEAIIKNVTADK